MREARRGIARERGRGKGALTVRPEPGDPGCVLPPPTMEGRLRRGNDHIVSQQA